MDDEDELAPPASAPQADVTLPDGQHLRVTVTRRYRDRSGVWWYELALTLPDRGGRHGPSLTSRTVTFSAPYPVVQALPGVSYASLDLPPPEQRKRWRLSPSLDSWADAYLHRPDCAQAQSTGGMATDEEALTAGADTITAPCPVCRPDTVLRHRN